MKNLSESSKLTLDENPSRRSEEGAGQVPAVYLFALLLLVLGGDRNLVTFILSPITKNSQTLSLFQFVS